MKPHFAPVPARALTDDRLEKSHYRILGYIAYRDRLNNNGRGCFARQGLMAEETRLHPTTVKNGCIDLVQWGYVAEQRDPTDRRSKIRRLVYNEQDRLGSPETTYSSGIGSPDGKLGSLQTREKVACDDRQVIDNNQNLTPNRALIEPYNRTLNRAPHDDGFDKLANQYLSEGKKVALQDERQVNDAEISNGDTQPDGNKVEGLRPVTSEIVANVTTSLTTIPLGHAGPDFSDVGVRKQRWEQKIMEEVRRRYPDDYAARLLERYANGDKEAADVFAAIDRQIKMRSAVGA